MNADNPVEYLDNLAKSFEKDEPARPPIEAFVTNWGKYVEGKAAGDWIAFPATPAAVQQLFEKIGIDGIRYEEWALTDYNSWISDLHSEIGELANLDEVNYLAHLMLDMPQEDRQLFEAAVEHGGQGHGAQALINIALNKDYYTYFPNCSDHESLGEYVVDNDPVYQQIKRLYPEHSQFDYERVGRDFDFGTTGNLASNGGYILPMQGQWIEHYGGPQDVPEEYRLHAGEIMKGPAGRNKTQAARMEPQPAR